MARRRIWSAVLVVVAACGVAAAPIANPPQKQAPIASTTTPSAVAASASSSASDADADAAASASSSPPSAPAVLFTTHGDLDGKGDAPITLTSDGFLHVGDLALQVEMVRNPDFWDKQASLVVVEIDKKKGVRGVLFTEPTGEGEDPPNHYRLVLAYDGALHLAYDHVLGTYGVTPLEFPGDGTAHYREDSWSACDRAKPKNVVVAHDVTLALDKKKTLVEIARKASKKTVKCLELAG